MDDRLDNELKKRISEVFENFGDTSAADDGWLELRKKFPEDERKRRAFAWIWWGAAAAVFFLFFGIGLWVYNAKVQPQKFTHNKLRNTKSNSISNSKEHSGGVNEASTADENNLADFKRNSKSPSPAIENELSKTNNRTQHSNSIKSLPKYRRFKAPGIVPQTLTNDTLTQKTELAQVADSNKLRSNTQSQQLNAVVKANNEPPGPVVVVPKASAKPINSMFAEDKKIDTKKSLENGDKRVRFGIYAATYFNYAKGSNNQVNVGAGLTSDIKLSNNLKLVTGITVAQNSLYYANGTPATVSNTVIVASSNIRNPGTSGNSVSYFIASPSNYSVGAVATVKNYNASLVGLDIPLNLKYEFNPQKSDTYFSAGLSSGTFINETYKSQYSSQTYFISSAQQTQGETTSKNFNNFYFAKMLNVAFGIGLPFGKNRLIFEPFLKYPIGGLGSQDIHFGAGGVNLKFNFQSPKK